MKQRDTLKVIIFGLITLGVYDLYWLYSTRKELVSRGQRIPPVILLILPFIVLMAVSVVLLIIASNPQQSESVLVLLLSLGVFVLALATIPVWLYWFYKYSQAVAAVTQNHMTLGMVYGLHILFAAFGITFVWAGMIQDEFNKVGSGSKITT